MAKWLVSLAFLGLAAPPSCAPPVLAEIPGGPPVGEERALVMEAVRVSYPAMPEAIVGMLTDARRVIGEDAPCELVDWLAAPGSGAPDGAASLTRHLSDYCLLGVADVDAGIAAHRLDGAAFRFDVVGNVVTLLAHSVEASVDICCSLQIPLTRIGASNFWAGRRRLGGVDAAMLSLFVVKPERTPDSGIQTFRGPAAPADPLQVAEGKLVGRMLAREMKSEALGETRRLSIYLPPGWSKKTQWPAVFLADNSAAMYAPMVEAMILAGSIRPIVLVSAEAGKPAVVGKAPTHYGADLRSAEYIRDFAGAGDRFQQHMAFFTDELTRYATKEFGVSTRREDRVVAGYSSGGVFALWAGVLHPEVYAFAIPMSPGIALLTAADLTAGVRTSFRFAGGLYEPPFIQTAMAATAVLRRGGFDASGVWLSAGHDPAQWRIVMHAALLEIFPPR